MNGWRSVVTITALALACLLPWTPSVHADEAGPAKCVQSSLQAVIADCVWSYEDYSTVSTSGDGHGWAVIPMCADMMLGTCVMSAPCMEGGVPGFRHYVYRDGVPFGTTCVPLIHIDTGPSHEQVVKAFRRLSWPGSTLSVEPPGGKTLVNLDTFFFTSNTEPTPKAVRLVGRQVQIVATPVSYTWTFEDDVEMTTTSAGGPYPDGDVVHVYEQPGEVSARVATTYAGTYRIGDKAWQTITETLTVEGPAIELAVLEAKPQLVLR